MRWHDEWHPGTQEPQVERCLFERVQVLLCDATYASHESVYASGLVECVHCGRPICVEVKTRQLKSGPKVTATTAARATPPTGTHAFGSRKPTSTSR
ncbi:MAG: hypothetical protein R6X33_02005 [Candidatus Brocadiia bacterium]